MINSIRDGLAPDADISVDDVRNRRLREVALGYRLFAACGWGDMGDGHISARDPARTDCFWVLRAGVSYHEASVSDLVLVGPNGDVVSSDGAINISAYHIHQPIHDTRHDVVSAAHVHTTWGTPFSAEVRPIEPITQESCLFFENHAVFDDEELQIQDTDGGHRIAACLGRHNAVIMRGHGLLTVGESVAEAIGYFVYLERAAEAHMKASDAQPISPGSARYAKEDLQRLDSANVCFQTMVKRRLGDAHIVE